MLGYVWIDRETVLGNNVKNCADDTEVRDKQEKQFASPPSPDSQGIDNTEFVASRMVQFNSISSTVAHLRSDLVASNDLVTQLTARSDLVESLAEKMSEAEDFNQNKLLKLCSKVDSLQEDLEEQ